MDNRLDDLLKSIRRAPAYGPLTGTERIFAVSGDGSQKVGWVPYSALMLATGDQTMEGVKTFTNGIAIGEGGALTADVGTGTAETGAAELDAMAGKITTEALTTAAAAEYVLTLTNANIAAEDLVFASVAYGTATAGEPKIGRVTPDDGEVEIVVQNDAAADAIDGTLVISFFVVKAPVAPEAPE